MSAELGISPIQTYASTASTLANIQAKLDQFAKIIPKVNDPGLAEVLGAGSMQHMPPPVAVQILVELAALRASFT
jgi:hypothetical protein